MTNNENVETTTKNTQTSNSDVNIPTTGSYFHSYPDLQKSPNSKSIVVRNVSFDDESMFDKGQTFKLPNGKEIKLYSRGNGKVVYGLHTFYNMVDGKRVAVNPHKIEYKFTSDEYIKGIMIDLNSPVYERNENGDEKLDSNGDRIPIPNLFWTKLVTTS